MQRTERSSVKAQHGRFRGDRLGPDLSGRAYAARHQTDRGGDRPRGIAQRPAPSRRDRARRCHAMQCYQCWHPARCQLPAGTDAAAPPAVRSSTRRAVRCDWWQCRHGPSRCAASANRISAPRNEVLMRVWIAIATIVKPQAAGPRVSAMDLSTVSLLRVGHASTVDPLTGLRVPEETAQLLASWPCEEPRGFFLFLPFRNWMSISVPLTRTSSQRR